MGVAQVSREAPYRTCGMGRIPVDMDATYVHYIRDLALGFPQWGVVGIGSFMWCVNSFCWILTCIIRVYVQLTSGDILDAPPRIKHFENAY